MDLKWRIGAVKITSVVESETPTSPRFLFGGLDKAGVLARAAKAPWLRPHFVSQDGYLLQKIQCLVIDTGEHRIAVDTCIGNDKDRHNELWHHLQGPFLEDMAKAGYPTDSITHVICTHLHIDPVAGVSGVGVGASMTSTLAGAQVRPAERMQARDPGMFRGTPSGL